MGIKPNLSTKIGQIALKNPVLVASGTFGHAKEFDKFIDLKKLGGIVTKTITIKPRLGNPPPRIVETPSGMLNAIGLQNPGVDGFIKEKLPFLKELGIPIIVSAMAYTVDEFVEVIKKLEEADGIDGYELNLSCPNVSYSNRTTSEKPDRTWSDSAFVPKMFAHDPKMIEDVVKAIRPLTEKMIVAKLGPDVSQIGEMAEAAEKGGADAIALINTFMAMVIDVKKRKPVLGNKTGGLSGPCIRPIAVRMTWEASRAVRVPVIGIGGIMTANDALEFLIAGAKAVQVGTANFMNPQATMEILAGIEKFMEEEKIKDLSEIIGSLKA